MSTQLVTALCRLVKLVRLLGRLFSFGISKLLAGHTHLQTDLD